MRVAAAVAKQKELHPEKFCPIPRCLWRLKDNEDRCPRHREIATLEGISNAIGELSKERRKK
jgi:hypothetical protein